MKGIQRRIVPGEAIFGSLTENRAGFIYSKFVFLFTDAAALVLIVKIILEFPGMFFKPGNAADCTDPDILLMILHHPLDHITSNTLIIIFLAVVEYMKRSAIVHVQSIPGGYPDDAVCIPENIIDGTVGKPVPVVELLYEKLHGRLGIT